MNYFEGHDSISETSDNNDDDNQASAIGNVLMTSQETEYSQLEPTYLTESFDALHEVGSQSIEMDAERFEDYRRESKLKQYNCLLQCIDLERKLGRIYHILKKPKDKD